MSTVTLPKGELFEMLDIIDEMVRFCSGSMPADRYHACANAAWVIAHRAAGDSDMADKLKADLLEKRARWLTDERERKAKWDAATVVGIPLGAVDDAADIVRERDEQMGDQK